MFLMVSRPLKKQTVFVLGWNGQMAQKTKKTKVIIVIKLKT